MTLATGSTCIYTQKKTLTFGLAVLLLLIPGCFRNARESDRCRVGAAFVANPIAQQVAFSRCEQIETRETLQDIYERERQDAQAQELRQQEAALAQQRQALREEERRAHIEREAAHAEIRRNPKAPEIGATVPEAARICGRQSGEFERERNAFSCYVGGAPVFIAGVYAGRVIGAVVFYEGADPDDLRRIAEKHHGSGFEQVVRGFRVWTWPELGITVGSYAHGATLTIRRPSEFVETGRALVYQ